MNLCGATSPTQHGGNAAPFGTSQHHFGVAHGSNPDLRTALGMMLPMAAGGSSPRPTTVADFGTGSALRLSNGRLRGETNGSKMQGKKGIKGAGLGG